MKASHNMADMRSRLEVIQGGEPTAAKQMQTFAKEQGSVISSLIAMQAPEEDTQVSPNPFELYTKTVRCLNRVFIGAVATRRFKLGIGSEFPKSLDGIGYGETLQPVKQFENAYFGRTTHNSIQNVAQLDTLLGMRASLLAWHFLARMHESDLRKPPRRIAENIRTHIALTIDSPEEQPEANILAATNDIEVNPHVKKAINDFTDIMTADSKSDLWSVNHFVVDSNDSDPELAHVATVISPQHYRAGALLVAAQMRLDTPLYIVT